MRKELEDKLREKYPQLFSNPRMRWGFACNDGWYQLIDVLSANITHYVKNQRDDAARVIRKIRAGANLKMPNKINKVQAIQVKEKFGTLRFYIQGGSPYIYGLIAMAESMSGRTCDVCGKPGTTEPSKSGYVCTRCDEHKTWTYDNA